MSLETEAAAFAQSLVPLLVRAMGTTSAEQLSTLHTAVRMGYRQGRIDEQAQHLANLESVRDLVRVSA